MYLVVPSYSRLPVELASSSKFLFALLVCGFVVFVRRRLIGAATARFLAL